jgi:hypothetical protein
MLPERNAAIEPDDEETPTTEDTDDEAIFLAMLHLIDESTDDDEG